jgi:hypothetical protein
VDWTVVGVWVGLAAAIVVGAVLGYRRGHRTVRLFVGVACGIALLILGDTVASNAPLHGSEDFSYRLVFIFLGFAVIVLFTGSFVLGVIMEWVMRRRHRLN